MKLFFEKEDKVIKDLTLVILLVDLAKQRGIHPDKLLRGTKLFQHDLSKPNLAISHQQFTQLINNTIKFINTPDIPFLLGSRLFPTQLGQIGLALSNAYNLQDMLRIIKCHQNKIFPFMFLMEKRHQGRRYLIFNHAITIERDGYHVFMCELLASVIISAIKWRMKALPTLHIRFPYQRPNYIEQYQAYFAQTFRFIPQFESLMNRSKAKSYLGLQISFTENVMMKPFEESSQVIKNHQLNKLEGKNFPVGIIQCVLQKLDFCFDRRNEVTLEKMAVSLSISTATFKRKLASHNTSYQHLLDLYRQQQAIFQLTEQGHSNETVAYALHFSDITNFRRSFKRWTGLTPNALKQVFKGFSSA
jgi:AraC-like DNA-binding protein